MPPSPIQAAALTLGVNPFYSALPATSSSWAGRAGQLCLLLHPARLKERSFVKGRLALPGATLFKNGTLARHGRDHVVSPVFLLCLGAASIPASFAYVNWMLHMSGYVLFGGIVGLALGEWGWCRLETRSACSGPACWSSLPRLTSWALHGVLIYPARYPATATTSCSPLVVGRVFQVNCRLFLVLL